MLDVLCDCSLSIALTKARGAPANPIRHPVIAYAFEQPFMVTVRSRSFGSTATIEAGLNPS